METIKIHTEYIELQSLLKMTTLIATGGEAKLYLINNKVLIDGVQDQRRGRKIYPGSKVEVGGRSFLIEKCM